MDHPVVVAAAVPGRVADDAGLGEVNRGLWSKVVPQCLIVKSIGLNFG